MLVNGGLLRRRLKSVVHYFTFGLLL